MSNVPNYASQGGSQYTIGASGTLVVASSGSIQIASGGVLAIAAGGSIRAPAGAISLAGVAGTMSFGSVVLTNGGSATVGVGFPVQGFAGVVTGRDGSISGVGEDRSLYSAGSVIVYGLSGTLAATTQRGTVGYVIYG